MRPILLSTILYLLSCQCIKAQTEEKILKTINGGIQAENLVSQSYNLTQQPSGTVLSLKSAWFINAKTGFVTGSNGLILKTIDGGSNWTALASGTTQTLFSNCFVGTMTGWAAGAHCTLLKTTNGGASWVEQSTRQSNDHFFSVYFVDTITGFLVTQRGNILKTKDGGSTWFNKMNNAVPFLNSIYFTNNQIGYAVGGTGFSDKNPSTMKVLKTIDGGENWTAITQGITDGMLISVHFPNTMNGFAVGIKNNGLGAILSTSDGGSSWTEKTVSKAYCLRSVYFTNKDTGFACGDGGFMLHTTDGGNTWIDISDSTTRHQNQGMYGSFYVNSQLGWIVGSNGTIVKYTHLSGSQTITIPSVTTQAVTSVNSTTATSGGNITSDGGGVITARGVCWGTISNPTTDFSKTSDGSGTGIFNSSLSGLLPNTTYYLRAYATNSAGTAYGRQVSFTTPSVIATVNDIDGNIYKTVVIGNQVWMAENLKTTHYSDGKPIPCVNDDWIHLNPYSSKAYCWYNEDSLTYAQTYGALYTWPAAMNGARSSGSNPSGVQGVCPIGWHMPSPSEWNQLIDYLGGYRVAGGKLKEAGTAHWNMPNSGATNVSGFTALAGGYRQWVFPQSGFDSGWIGEESGWWTSAVDGSYVQAVVKKLNYVTKDVNEATVIANYGFSVRCVKN